MGKTIAFMVSYINYFLRVNMELNSNNISKYLKFILIFTIALLIFVILFYVIYFAFINDYSLSNQTDTWGQFGDYLGGVLNPIFAFFTILLLLITIYQQKNELKDNKEQKLKEDIVLILKEITDRITPWLDQYEGKDIISKTENIKENYNERRLFRIAFNLKLVYRHLLELEKIDKNNQLVEYYKLLYVGDSIIFNQKGYIDQNVSDYFKKIEMYP